MTIRLLLVDDHAVVREGVGRLLDAQAGMRVIGSFGDGREAVRAVSEGKRYLSQRISGEAIERYLGERAADNPLLRLSARERQVLQLVVEGRTSAEAAELLGLSPKSVESYRSRMLTKLGLEDLPSLVKFAIRHGVTSVE